MQFIDEPSRRTPVCTTTQVLVVGGSAGTAAAIAAARNGADTILVERSGALGDLATGGLVTLLLTLDDGNGRQVVGGVCQEVTERVRPVRARPGRHGPADRRRHRHHRPVDEVRRALLDPVPLPPVEGILEPAGRRSLYLRRSSDPSCDQGDPALHGHGPGRRQAAAMALDARITPSEISVSDLQVRLGEQGAILEVPGAPAP